MSSACVLRLGPRVWSFESRVSITCLGRPCLRQVPCKIPVFFSEVELVGLTGIGCGPEEIGTGVEGDVLVEGKISGVFLAGVGYGPKEIEIGAGRDVSGDREDKVSGFFFGGVDDLWRMGVNVSVMSLDRVVDIVEHKKVWF